MPCHKIHDPWPSIYRKHSDATLQFHLKAINGPYPSCGGREKNSTLRENLLRRNYSLHIESASLCPLSLNTVFSPQALSLLLREPHCLFSMIFPLVEDWSGGNQVPSNWVSTTLILHQRKAHKKEAMRSSQQYGKSLGAEHCVHTWGTEVCSLNMK